MFAGLPLLSHEQQQQAVERIQELMSQGMSSGEAITLVAQEIRASHTGERVVALFDEDESEDEIEDNNESQNQYRDEYEGDDQE